MKKVLLIFGAIALVASLIGNVMLIKKISHLQNQVELEKLDNIGKDSIQLQTTEDISTYTDFEGINTTDGIFEDDWIYNGDTIIIPSTSRDFCKYSKMPIGSDDDFNLVVDSSSDGMVVHFRYFSLYSKDSTCVKFVKTGGL